MNYIWNITDGIFNKQFNPKQPKIIQISKWVLLKIDTFFNFSIFIIYDTDEKDDNGSETYQGRKEF